MESCITEDLKSVLLLMLEKKRDHAMIIAIVEDTFQVCEDRRKLDKAAKDYVAGSGKKAMHPEYGWGKADYFDEGGKKHEYGSPSEAFKELFGVSPSTSIECEVVAGETKCVPKTMVMSFQSRGMIVRGNGEPPPAIMREMNEKDRVRLHQNWNQSLHASGKHFTVYHPKSPQALELDK